MELLEPLAPQPWQPLTVCPIGDIQAGSVGTDWSHLQRHIDKALARNAYFIGTGDYSDFLSPSNRRALMMAGLYDTAMELIDRWCGGHVQHLMDILAPTQGRWLSLVHGHHYYEFGRNDTTDTRLAKFLGCKFAGSTSITRINFKSDQLQRATDCRILTAHGTGKGYGFLNRIRPGFPDIDIFIMGHNCELDFKKRARLVFYGRPNHLKMRNADTFMVLAGSFFRGYAEGSTLGEMGMPYGSYVERAGLEPLPIGGQFITITPVAKSDYSCVEISVESGD